MHKLILVCIVFFVSTLCASAQRLKIGEKLPQITFDSVVGYGAKEIVIPNHDQKLLILDFWSTACSSCISGISKLDSIEKQFNGDVFVLPIIDQGLSFKEVENYWNKNRLLNGSKRWTAIDWNKTLKNLFPRNGVPFYVYIDRNGTFRGSGGYEQFNSEIIKKILIDSSFNLSIKIPKRHFDISEVLFKENTNWLTLGNNAGWFSFAPYKPEYESGIFDLRATNKSFRSIKFVNSSIPDMYEYCFRLLGYMKFEFVYDIPKSKMFYTKQDPLLFKEDWDINNRFNAEFRFRWYETDHFCFKRIIEELDKRFSLKTNYNQKKVIAINKKGPSRSDGPNPLNQN